MSSYRVQVAVSVQGTDGYKVGTEVVVEADNPREAALASTALAGAAIAFENSLQGDFERWQEREIEKVLDRSPFGKMIGKLSKHLFGTTEHDPPTDTPAVPSAEELERRFGGEPRS